MSYARSKAYEIEGVRRADDYQTMQHIRFVDDYVTFCGIKCEDWISGDSGVKAASDAFTCKRCVKAYWK